MEKNEAKRLFPNLLKEIECEEQTVAIGSVRSNTKSGEEYALGEPLDVISYLRKCEKEEEALEIIGYFEKQGKISSEYAKNLRIQLLQQGLRSFGKKD
ncbi:MAG TPA: DUF2095 family protein [Candidatus Bathyarchaeia archaeon]|nr:MAG: hypothetical protein A3K70_03665 [Candidatus Bathyarchaeota archaeon RBG_16_48_13]HJX22832.1 DUF2095 family protein [Candidatus Bathyarchaeia archaeon]